MFEPMAELYLPEPAVPGDAVHTLDTALDATKTKKLRQPALCESPEKKSLSRSPKYKPIQRKIEIAVVGAGWFGVHIAKTLAELGFAVTLFESHDDIMNGISGKFGVRIHAGPHYPRSPATRYFCRAGLLEFLMTYPKLVNEHLYSIYALGREDANGNPSKISLEKFREVCTEFQSVGELDLNYSEYNQKEVLAAFDLKEPSAVVGPQLRTEFKRILKEAGVTIKYNSRVDKVTKDFKFSVLSNGQTQEFDNVINTTSYQSLVLPLSKTPFNIRIRYQPCVALVYKDLQPGTKPISFIVMDGWFPCLMPYDDREERTEQPSDRYIVTHGKFTILDSCKSVEEANNVLLSLKNNETLQKKIREDCEKAMETFWPGFTKRFEYVSYIGEVLAKIKSNGEFRGSVVYQEPNHGQINVIPGKITNIFDAARETISLINNHHNNNECITDADGNRYTSTGVLSKAIAEFTVPITQENTCELHPYKEWFGSSPEEKKHTDLPAPVAVSTETKKESEDVQQAYPIVPRAPQNHHLLRSIFIVFCIACSLRMLGPAPVDKKEKELLFLTVSFISAFLAYTQWVKLKDSATTVTQKLSQLGLFHSIQNKPSSQDEISKQNKI